MPNADEGIATQRPSAPPAGRLAQSFEEAFLSINRMYPVGNDTETPVQKGKDAGKPPVQKSPAETAEVRDKLFGLILKGVRDAKAAGYAAADYNLAGYAVIAFADDTAQRPFSAYRENWVPIAHALRKDGDVEDGRNLWGERFYDDVDDLLRAEPTALTADVLEVFLLCLLLGFRGEYLKDDADHSAQRESRRAAMKEKIDRIRGGRPTVLTPDWAIPDEPGPGPGPRPDLWARPLAVGSLVVALLVVALFVVNHSLLGASVRELRADFALNER